MRQFRDIVSVATVCLTFVSIASIADLSAGPTAVFASGKCETKTLSFTDRVSYQTAIEEVYWRHRIWPKENSGPKPVLDKIMSKQQIENKVWQYLRESQALEDYWERPITSEQLEAEMRRMAAQTKQPEILREIFAALGNDPLVVAECLARAALGERLITDLYANDQRIHGEVRRRAEAELRTLRSGSDKQPNGRCTQTEFIKRDNAEGAVRPGSIEEFSDVKRGVKVSAREWRESLARLVAVFGGKESLTARPLVTEVLYDEGEQDRRDANVLAQIKIGVSSPLQEVNDRYYSVAVTEKGKDRLKLTTTEWLKEPLRSWTARTVTQVRTTTVGATANYVLPVIGGFSCGCIDDTWEVTPGPPDGRRFHTAVWTGSEMIVWGGVSFSDYFATGGRYNPTTDSWTTTTRTSAPSARANHSAIWTGTEMIVWGGYDGVNYLTTGGRYDPSTDSWSATSTANAPTGRYNHTAVWTGSEMIIWGGRGSGPNYFNGVNSGGRYNFSTDSWTVTGSANAPTARADHSAVWTGSEMIVWGGYSYPPNSYWNSGGRYNPVTDSWTATVTNGAPEARHLHTAIWTGSEMIVWGGYSGSKYLKTGGKYNPNTDSWTASGATNAPSARAAHTAVWTGGEMIVWGGYDGDWLSTGGKYNLATDNWTATGGMNAPSARSFHTSLWTGSEIIVWGGGTGRCVNTGGRFNPSTNSWTATGASNAPSSRGAHSGMWTGSEMIVWGGYNFPPESYWNSGGRYNPATDSWTATSIINAPEGRFDDTTVWTGSEMIVWGGYANGNYFRYWRTIRPSYRQLDCYQHC